MINNQITILQELCLLLKDSSNIDYDTLSLTYKFNPQIICLTSSSNKFIKASATKNLVKHYFLFAFLINTYTFF